MLIPNIDVLLQDTRDYIPERYTRHGKIFRYAEPINYQAHILQFVVKVRTNDHVNRIIRIITGNRIKFQ